MDSAKLDTFPDPGERFTLGECISSGVLASVYEATDSTMSNKKVAIKILKLSAENEVYIEEEYRVLEHFSDHPNLPEFYGAFKVDKDEGTEIWFAMEFCEGGSVMDIVRTLFDKNRRMAEEHIAFILKEVTKALIYLHSNNTILRSISGDNILLTKEGEVKLVDFGLSRSLSSPLGKRNTCIGAACWMAPEVVLSGSNGNGYGSRADVWALGITAIELGDGKPPLSSMHPTRVMFQIVRNPPPGLYRPGSWSEQYNDFIGECLEKNPEYRPFMEELLLHPFLTAIPENSHYLTQEMKKILDDFSQEEKPKRELQPIIKNNLLKLDAESEPVQMYVEDLAAIENINEDIFLNELKGRFSLGYFHNFVGDVLLILNPNEEQKIYNNLFHSKYILKSRSTNPPHIFSIADRAYQDALHHEVPQHIILSGESGSGKTTSLRYLVSHLAYLGDVINSGQRGQHLLNAMEVVHAFTNAGTSINTDSTRCVTNVKVGYGPSGKVSTGKIIVWQLEKWRISSTDISQSNFHILYYFYDAIQSKGDLNKYLLDPDKNYRYLRISSNNTNPKEIRNNPENNIKKYEALIQHFKYFKLSPEEKDTIFKTLAAILNLGEIRFDENKDTNSEIENPEVCAKVAELLNIDEKKFTWALTNYCLIEKGTAVRRKNNCNQARDARDMLANCLYARLVDWIVNFLNSRMARNRAIFGEKYFVNILDYFGFECFKRNDLEQLLVNTFNEQMQYLYIQRVFAWETLEELEDEVPPLILDYYDNKRAVDRLLGKPEGIFALVDEASKTGHNYQRILESIEKLDINPYIDIKGEKEFLFSHYTGRIKYDVREMSQKNRYFLPPEMTEALRLSSNPIIKEFFCNKLNKGGNLLCSELKETNKWNSALIADQDLTKKLSSETQYSQTKHMRTAVTTFRSISLEILRELSVGSTSGGTHFVRCIRTDLASKPNTFNQELVKQQMRALTVLDTARARQMGFPYRITFPEFLKRYKFLAFDFDETVDVTKDNCRLLLVRLKMEGWIIGKTKVFLKYYNEEYLSRLYETQVKKIIKIQSMMRAFLARRNVASKIKNLKQKKQAKLIRQLTRDLSDDAAALMIQKAYRGYNVRKKYGPIINKDSGQIDEDTVNFLKPFVNKWRKRSIFQVLLQYRSAKFQDLINLSQQVHIFNQNVMHELQKCNEEIDLEKVDPTANVDSWLGDRKPSVWKVPFHFDEIPYYNTEHMCDSGAGPEEEQDTWDSPLEWRRSTINEIKTKDNKTIDRSPTPNIQPHPNDETLINTPYSRDPSTPLTILLTSEKEIKKTITFEPIPTQNKIASPKHKAIGRIQTPENQIIISPKKIRTSHVSDKNFEGANQDFEFIRSPKPDILKRRPANPIAELESIGRKNVEKSNEDDPPFNFQGMLRKTNFKRDSMKKIPEVEEELPYTKVLKNKINKLITSTELAPGMILEGIETAL